MNHLWRWNSYRELCFPEWPIALAIYLCVTVIHFLLVTQPVPPISKDQFIKSATHKHRCDMLRSPRPPVESWHLQINLKQTNVFPENSEVCLTPRYDQIIMSFIFIRLLFRGILSLAVIIMASLFSLLSLSYRLSNTQWRWWAVNHSIILFFFFYETCIIRNLQMNWVNC